MPGISARGHISDAYIGLDRKSSTHTCFEVRAVLQYQKILETTLLTVGWEIEVCFDALTLTSFLSQACPRSCSTVRAASSFCQTTSRVVVDGKQVLAVNATSLQAMFRKFSRQSTEPTRYERMCVAPLGVTCVLEVVYVEVSRCRCERRVDGARTGHHSTVEITCRVEDAKTGRNVSKSVSLVMFTLESLRARPRRAHRWV